MMRRIHKLVNYQLISNVLFIFWLISFALLVGLAYLVQHHVIASYRDNFTILLYVHIITGILFMFSGCVVYLPLIFKLALHHKLISFVVLLLLCINIFNRFDGRIQKIVNKKYIQTSTDLKRIYLAIFYDIYGNLPDEQMATEEELFAAVNNYRAGLNLNQVYSNHEMCKAAEEKLWYLNQLGSVVFLDNANMEENGNAEIFITFRQPMLAKNVIDFHWARPFSRPRDVLDNPYWTTGCLRLRFPYAVFAFGK